MFGKRDQLRSDEELGRVHDGEGNLGWDSGQGVVVEEGNRGVTLPDPDATGWDVGGRSRQAVERGSETRAEVVTQEFFTK